MTELKWIKLEDGRIICPFCLKSIIGKELYAVMQSLEVEDHFVLKAASFEKELNSFRCRAQYIRRKFYKEFKVIGIRELNMIVIRRML